MSKSEIPVELKDLRAKMRWATDHIKEQEDMERFTRLFSDVEKDRETANIESLKNLGTFLDEIIKKTFANSIAKMSKILITIANRNPGSHFIKTEEEARTLITPKGIIKVLPNEGVEIRLSPLEISKELFGNSFEIPVKIIPQAIREIASYYKVNVDCKKNGLILNTTLGKLEIERQNEDCIIKLNSFEMISDFFEKTYVNMQS